MGPSEQCRVLIAPVNLRFGFLRLSTIQICPHMLKLDTRELRNSEGKFMWVVGGGMR